MARRIVFFGPQRMYTIVRPGDWFGMGRRRIVSPFVAELPAGPEGPLAPKKEAVMFFGPPKPTQDEGEQRNQALVKAIADPNSPLLSPDLPEWPADFVGPPRPVGLGADIAAAAEANGHVKLKRERGRPPKKP